MKATFRKNINGQIEVYIPKKDLEAVVIEIQKEGDGWGGIFKLSNGWVLEVPYHDKEPSFPITLEVKKIGEEVVT
ncbi:nitrogen fixation protein FixT [Thermocrinis albus DSM 14484]|uniref:Nitrogen fixation protein FixT n=1 Tax=Thermocrinis albus (strain DSM 14484 / JCM 11386 / HI 11/12) TaxID=638303 RepID=D3SPG0_THEAH|nr:putative nitrogen fixation protein NifT [Thermocrinis albus]ADC89047.1 nitrogen fixation protein FixT [Thermocrinis albus DSM 14484]